MTKTEKAILGTGLALGAFFAIKKLVEAAPPGEAEFTVADLVIEPAEVYVGEPVSISVLVTNVGGETGTKIVTLEVS